LAGAQKAMPIIGVLLYGTKQLHQEHPLVTGLRDAGLVDGKTATILLREAEGRPERLPALAAELVAMTPDVIITAGPQPIRAVKEATSTIPIVMAIVSDPVTYGFVASMSRPAGNLTGMSMVNTELSSKRIALLREVAPHISRIAVFTDPTMGRKAWTKPRLPRTLSGSIPRSCPSPRRRSRTVLPKPSAARRRRCS